MEMCARTIITPIHVVLRAKCYVFSFLFGQILKFLKISIFMDHGIDQFKYIASEISKFSLLFTALGQG